MSLDSVQSFHQEIARLRAENKTFAVATIIKVDGSASARTGSKAIFNDVGHNSVGWVGGGCAERFIGEQVVEALRENKSRIVTADMDDEILGLGVACGGKMHVFIDPILPSEKVLLPDLKNFKKEIEILSAGYGWTVLTSEKEFATYQPEDLFLEMSSAIAMQRGKSGRPLRQFPVKASPAEFEKVMIIGRSRITEAMARHCALLGWDVEVVAPALRTEDYPQTVRCHCLADSYHEIKIPKNTAVLVASHTAQDPSLVQLALAANSPYVAMIGSQKRVLEVLNHLQWSREKLAQENLFIPAGLDIGAKNPEEIALSIVSEMILARRSL